METIKHPVTPSLLPKQVQPPGHALCWGHACLGQQLHRVSVSSSFGQCGYDLDICQDARPRTPSLDAPSPGQPGPSQPCSPLAPPSAHPVMQVEEVQLRTSWQIQQGPPGTDSALHGSSWYSYWQSCEREQLGQRGSATSLSCRTSQSLQHAYLIMNLWVGTSREKWVLRKHRGVGQKPFEAWLSSTYPVASLLVSLTSRKFQPHSLPPRPNPLNAAAFLPLPAAHSHSCQTHSFQKSKAALLARQRKCQPLPRPRLGTLPSEAVSG